MSDYTPRKEHRFTFAWREYNWMVPVAPLPADEPDVELIECPSDYRKETADSR